MGQAVPIEWVFTIPISDPRQDCKQIGTVAMSLPPPPMNSARPGVTAALMAETGLSESILRRLVERFYDRIRADEVLGPIFSDHIDDWPRHLDRMVDFWSSVALMTGAYHGQPMRAHAHLKLTPAHFARWLALFEDIARAHFSPEGAAHMIERAQRIARSLEMGLIPLTLPTARDRALQGAQS